MSDHTEFGAFAQERSHMYWLLSRLFLKVPDAAHLAELQTDLSDALESGPLDELRSEVEAALRDPEAAAVEFTRRLVIVSKASGEDLPFESFVREGTVPGKATEDVMACIEDAGFSDISRDAPSPDHIGAEMKFMALLCYEESQAWADSTPGEAKKWLAMQRYFLSRHLGEWGAGYCDGLEERAQHPYMKAVARLARRCLVADVTAVEEIYAELNRQAGTSPAGVA